MLENRLLEWSFYLNSICYENYKKINVVDDNSSTNFEKRYKLIFNRSNG